ncbi:SipW-dependent-type signal peptide-containing protein [Ruminococcus flavefaciens]|uniref:Alternate signal-mediated exported protein n=1 Tax=Ruminococcus flavefaciens TaxID=1265 RepID=A0A315Y6A8_RUMFL|nr:SipW-dependent-type signal peptide-containing protein [Ruminococcus flavefaciens]PWJ15518.1 alternate signal-mediated exported protein [Ruminococcus flavefaciens]SSA40758.1 alternate signal-mediated exported protein, CPF_0494 family [Ruminococcus flavefaciens]
MKLRIKKIKKKYIVLVLSAVLIAVTAFTLAYFTSSDEVTNRFMGVYPPEEKPVADITVTEIFEPPTEKSDEPFQKSVQIENNGNIDCYIRVRLEFSSSEVRDISWLSNDDEKDNEDAYINASEYRYSSLPDGWEYREEDGFYYYTEAVAPSDRTASLIKWVKTVFPDDDSVDTDEYDIYVYSEAVPADDEDGERMTYEEAWR